MPAPPSQDRNEEYSEELDTSKIHVETGTLQSLTDSQGGRFRILVIGRTGVGKSTIVASVFGVPPSWTGVSAREVGTPTQAIWKEITFQGKNNNLILHDTRGFEAGDNEAMQQVQRFIEFRKRQTTIAEQLHAIWYCIKIDERPITAVEDYMFTKVDIGNIPVIIVFTQFDVLIDRHEARIRRKFRAQGVRPADEELERLAYNAAVEDYDRNYRGQLERKFALGGNTRFVRVGIPGADSMLPDDVPRATMPQHGLDDLVKATSGSMVLDSMKILLAAAQRYSADQKLEASALAAIEHVWRVQATNYVPLIPFIGASALYRSFTKILGTVCEVWGIPGVLELIHDTPSRNLFLKGVFDADIGWRVTVGVFMSLNFLGPLTASMTLGMILKLMAGIALINENLFWRLMKQKATALTKRDIELAADEFRRSHCRRAVCHFIDGEVGLDAQFSKKGCLKIIREAIRSGKSAEHAELTQRHTIGGFRSSPE